MRAERDFGVGVLSKRRCSRWSEMLYSPNDRSLFQEAITMPEPVITVRSLLTSSCLLLCLAMPVWGATLGASTMNGAEYNAKHSSKGQLDPAVIKAEIFLDRARFLPGEIDGKLGDNAKKALQSFAAANGLPRQHRHHARSMD
jgi:hypothetical protein